MKQTWHWKKKKLSASLSTAFHSKCLGKYHGQWLHTIVQKSTAAANISYLALPVTPRRRSNSIPWCTSFHVILPLRTWHIMISNLQHARNEHRSARCGWFQTCFGSAASAFEIIELAYIHCALKENFSVTLTKKGFTCISLICRELLVRSVATTNTKYETRQLIRFAGRTETMTDLKSGSNKTAATLWS